MTMARMPTITAVAIASISITTITIAPVVPITITITAGSQIFRPRRKARIWLRERLRLRLRLRLRERLRLRLRLRLLRTRRPRVARRHARRQGNLTAMVSRGPLAAMVATVADDWLLAEIRSVVVRVPTHPISKAETSSFMTRRKPCFRAWLPHTV